MAKKKTKNEEKPEVGEQLDLIDFRPKNSKEIIIAGRTYKKFQAARQAALVKEIEQKQLILELVEKSKPQRLAGGRIKFELEGLEFEITPRDQKVSVKEKTKGKKEFEDVD